MSSSAIIFVFCRLANVMEFITGYFFMKCIDCTMKRRKGKLLFLPGLLLYTIVSTLVVFPKDMTNISVALILFVLANFMLYQGKWIVKISMIFIFLPIAASVNLLHTDVGGHIFMQFFYQEDQLANAVFSAAFVIRPVFWGTFYHFFSPSLKKIQNIFTHRAWAIMDVISLASFCALFSCIYLAPEYKTYFIWPCIVACLITNIGSVRFAAYLADGLHADLERKNLQLQNNYYEELEHNQDQIRKFRHDMNNHLSVVGNLLDEGDFSEAKEYFRSISGYMQTVNRKFCRNSVVNAVLNVKYQMMTDAFIDAFLNIDIDKMMFIDDVSLCTIFANTLDNAIEVCRKIDDAAKRKLELRCHYTENGYFSFELINSKINEITEKKGRFISDKEDQSAHGIGISSVKEIVDKYDGTLDISYDRQWFKVVILIG